MHATPQAEERPPTASARAGDARHRAKPPAPPTKRHRAPRRSARRRRWRPGTSSLLLGAALLGLIVATVPLPWSARPTARSDSSPEQATGAFAASAGSSLQAPVPAGKPSAAVGVPVSVSLPRLGISSRLQPLGLEEDGSLQSPSQYGEAGWYSDGVRPGALGPAVIAGHVDSYTGPAVFFRLPLARLGDEVMVRDSSGVTRRFTVTDVQQYPKDRFPSAAVYGPAAQPVLRLITCYGAFDGKTRSYVDNLVVSAALAA